MNWKDLSDDELQSRLTQRGIPEDFAEVLVEDRDDLAAAVIDELLEGEA